LIDLLTNDVYRVEGKSTFKEEFVTCGGVSLQSVDLNTMQSKVVKNLYFAGEILDIDAITGGYNLQAAWTTGYIAGKLM
jgi:predicted flavoprotein YhiN